ncbi:MAG: hypothetical protein HUU29_10270 [Planctomycetaceae bacterium]|nr:hypothetical protein [Planctomycetaceae bacterium]
MFDGKFMIGISLVLVGGVVIAGFVLSWMAEAILIALAAAAIYAGMRIMTHSIRERKDGEKKP